MVFWRSGAYFNGREVLKSERGVLFMGSGLFFERENFSLEGGIILRTGVVFLGRGYTFLEGGLLFGRIYFSWEGGIIF